LICGLPRKSVTVPGDRDGLVFDRRGDVAAEGGVDGVEVGLVDDGVEQPSLRGGKEVQDRDAAAVGDEHFDDLAARGDVLANQLLELVLLGDDVDEF
jgi:hypothetical protein